MAPSDWHLQPIHASLSCRPRHPMDGTNAFLSQHPAHPFHADTPTHSSHFISCCQILENEILPLSI